MAHTVKKGGVVFAATVAMVFCTMLISGSWRNHQQYAANSEIVNESFDVYGVRVVEINVESGLNIEFSDAAVGRATLKTERGSKGSTYTGRINNGVLQINGSGYAFDNVLTLPSSVKEIRIATTKDGQPDLRVHSVDEMSVLELTIKANQPANLSLTNMNIKYLLVNLPYTTEENAAQQLALHNTKIGDFEVSMNFGDLVRSGDTRFEKAQFKLGDSVNLSGWSARLVQKMVISSFKVP